LLSTTIVVVGCASSVEHALRASIALTTRALPVEANRRTNEIIVPFRRHSYGGSTHPAVVERAPGFARAWARIANPRIRFRATLGGNVMARRVRYECSLLLTALHARLEFASPAGRTAMSPQDILAGRVPARSLLTAVSIETSSLVFFRYERSLRPLMTLAIALRRSDDGLLLSCAVASEFLQPVLIDQPLPGMRPNQIARNAKAIARDLFARLPAGFADPVLSNQYARTAGAVLLARQLAGIADD
jgi:carbon-monoxide dehydrogenase medium subunit